MVTARPPMWWPIDADPEQVIADVKRWFPDACAWFGEYTGKWWAIAENRMVEADNPNELHVRIASVVAQSRAGRTVPPARSGTGLYDGEAFYPSPSRLRRLRDGVRRLLMGDEG